MKNEDDFIQRCLKLEEEIFKIKTEEESDRVWMAVMCRIINEIIAKQNNPQKALLQLLESFKGMPLPVKHTQVEGSEKD